MPCSNATQCSTYDVKEPLIRIAGLLARTVYDAVKECLLDEHGLISVAEVAEITTLK